MTTQQFLAFMVIGLMMATNVSIGFHHRGIAIINS